MGAALGSRSLSRSCCCSSTRCIFSIAFSLSIASAWPRTVARPVMRSRVRHSTLFCAQGEQPPGRASHRILRICGGGQYYHPAHPHGRWRAYLAPVASLTSPRRASTALLRRRACCTCESCMRVVGGCGPARASVPSMSSSPGRFIFANGQAARAKEFTVSTANDQRTAAGRPPSCATVRQRARRSFTTWRICGMDESCAHVVHAVAGRGECLARTSSGNGELLATSNMRPVRVTSKKDGSA